MARSHYWQYLLNQEGQPIPYATIQLYEASTTTPVSAYATEVATSIISAGVLTTNTAGYFDFWAEPSLYPDGMKFDLLWSKPGTITSGGVYDVYVAIVNDQVDEADTDTTKNKLVSNNLARIWEAKPKILATSASTFVSVTAGAIETGYDYYYDVDHAFTQGYPVVHVYVNEGKALSNIPEYIDSDTIRVWMKTVDVSGGGIHRFTLVG